MANNENKSRGEIAGAILRATEEQLEADEWKVGKPVGVININCKEVSSIEGEGEVICEKSGERVGVKFRCDPDFGNMDVEYL